MPLLVSLVFPLCPAVTATAAIVSSAFWAATPAFGRLRRIRPLARGSGAWVTVVQTWVATTTISRTGSLSAWLGIDNLTICLFDYLFREAESKIFLRNE